MLLSLCFRVISHTPVPGSLTPKRSSDHHWGWTSCPTHPQSAIYCWACWQVSCYDPGVLDNLWEAICFLLSSSHVFVVTSETIWFHRPTEFCFPRRCGLSFPFISLALEGSETYLLPFVFCTWFVFVNYLTVNKSHTLIHLRVFPLLFPLVALGPIFPVTPSVPLDITSRLWHWHKLHLNT